MAEPIEYKEEKDSRFSASTSDLPLASDSASRLRLAKGIVVASTSSSIAELVCRPNKSSMLSEARDARRAATGGRPASTSTAAVSGSLARAFLPEGGCHVVPLAELVLSVESVRVSGESMAQGHEARRHAVLAGQVNNMAVCVLTSERALA
jgi:hypothetical protein